MIVVTSPLKQDEIKAVLNHFHEDAHDLVFEKRVGMDLYFKTDAPDEEAMAQMVKAAIKHTPWGNAIYFTVKVVNG